MMKLPTYLTILFVCVNCIEGFSSSVVGLSLQVRCPRSQICRRQAFPSSQNPRKGDEVVDLQVLKEELLQYLEKRKELGADDIAEAYVDDVVMETDTNGIV